MILGAGLLLALLLVVLSPILRGPKLKLRWVILVTPFVWAALFGACRGVAYLTQRDLPAPSFTTPFQFFAGAATPLALAVSSFLLFGRLRAGVLALAAGTLIVASAALNYHACFTEDALLLRRCLSFTEQRYEYRQVRSLKYVRDWRVLVLEVHRPYFVIGFDDGSGWTSNEGFRTTTPHLDMEAIHVVTARSNVMLQQVQFSE